MAGISPAIFFVIVFLIIIAATGRDVPTSGYSLNNMEFLTGFHGKSLSGKKSKK